jgi:hypothetical protein
MRIRVIAVLASVLVLRAVAPSASQTTSVTRSEDPRLALHPTPLGLDERASVLPVDGGQASVCARGECGRRVGRSTVLGAGIGAVAALGYVLVRCVPQAARAESVSCSGRVPVALLGSGTVVGLVSGFVSSRCRTRRSADTPV